MTPAQNSAVSSAIATSMSVAPTRRRNRRAIGRLDFDGAMDTDSEAPARSSGDTTGIPLRQGCKTARLHLCTGVCPAGRGRRSAFDDLDLRAALAAEIGDAPPVVRMRVVARRDLREQAKLAAAGRTIRGLGRFAARIHVVNFT